MIIVEGADLVGKSTVADAVLQHPRIAAFGMIYGHLGLLPKGWDYVLSYLDAMGQNFVYDRFHMSELVYGKVVRDGPSISDEEYRIVDAVLALVGAYTLVITAEESLIRKRWRDKEIFGLDQILECNKHFVTIGRQGRLGSYEPRCDSWHHCTPEKPYPTEEVINGVVTGYWTRRESLRSVSRRAQARNLLALLR